MMPLKLVKGKMRRVPVEATPTLEHQVGRLFTIATNFNARFVALEQAIAHLQNNPAAPPKRTRKPSQKSAA